MEGSLLKIWRDMSCWSRQYPFKLFKGCLPQILLSRLLNILSHIKQYIALALCHQKWLYGNKMFNTTCTINLNPTDFTNTRQMKIALNFIFCWDITLRIFYLNFSKKLSLKCQTWRKCTLTSFVVVSFFAF